MIYLFNSAFRPRYLKNVLNTLYLPEHCSNEYRYRFTGDKPNISPGFYSGLQNLHLGTECVVTFIDRYSDGGYTYHPLRKARYLGHRVVADYVYLKVELLDFIYPQDLQRFNQNLLGQLNDKGIPRLTDSKPEYAHDGLYAIESNSIFGRFEDFKAKDDAWTTAVTALSSTKALRTDGDQWPVFIKLGIQSRKERVAPTPIIQNQTALFKFTKDEVFELVLSYRFPQQRIDTTSQCRIDINLGENIRALGASSLTIDSASNSAIISFTTKRYAEDNRGNIGLVEPSEAKPQIIVPDAQIEYLLEEGSGFWLQIVLALTLYAVAGAMIGVDLAKLVPFSWCALAKAALPRVALAAIQAIGLFWLFKRIGKKVL
jgi:hypothetical protein